MKVTINREGMLEIYSETGLESFALKSWFEQFMLNPSTEFIIVDCSSQKNEILDTNG